MPTAYLNFRLTWGAGAVLKLPVLKSDLAGQNGLGKRT